MSDDWKGFVLCFMLVNLPGDSTLQWAMFSVPGNTWFDVKNLVLCCVYIVLYLNTIVLSTTELMDGNLPCNHDSWSTCAQCWFVWYFSSAVIYSRGNVACVHVQLSMSCTWWEIPVSVIVRQPICCYCCCSCLCGLWCTCMCDVVCRRIALPLPQIAALVTPPPPPYLHLATSEMWCWSGGRGI